MYKFPDTILCILYISHEFNNIYIYSKYFFRIDYYALIKAHFLKMENWCISNNLIPRNDLIFMFLTFHMVSTPLEDSVVYFLFSCFSKLVTTIMNSPVVYIWMNNIIYYEFFSYLSQSDLKVIIMFVYLFLKQYY